MKDKWKINENLFCMIDDDKDFYVGMWVVVICWLKQAAVQT